MADKKSISKDAKPAPNEKAKLSDAELDSASGGGLRDTLKKYHDSANNIVNNLKG